MSATTPTPPAGPTPPEIDPNAAERHTLPSFDGIRENEGASRRFRERKPVMWRAIWSLLRSEKRVGERSGELKERR